MDELSSEITKGLEIIPVSQMEEVLKIALMRTRRKKDGNEECKSGNSLWYYK